MPLEVQQIGPGASAKVYIHLCHLTSKDRARRLRLLLPWQEMCRSSLSCQISELKTTDYRENGHRKSLSGHRLKNCAKDIVPDRLVSTVLWHLAPRQQDLPTNCYSPRHASRELLPGLNQVAR